MLLQIAYEFIGLKKDQFPVSERVLSLPDYPEMTDEMLRVVVDKVTELVVY